jgi:DNA-binding MarR family transcriptional regulator
MRNAILEKVSSDLVSIPPILTRGLRKKLVKLVINDNGLDITPHQIEIMRVLDVEKKALPIGEIGEKLHIPKAQMTQLIDKLVDLDIVERVTAKSDRRALKVSFTDRGKSIMENHKKSIKSAFQDMMSHLTDEDLSSLSLSLRKLGDTISRLY